METKILRVVRQGEAFSVHEYVCAMLGNLAACKFYEGDVVAATLRFSTHEYQGQVFQEILATDIVKLNN